MKVKNVLVKFLKDKKVSYPITRKKVEKAGHNMSDFLKELKTTLEKADDIKTIRNQGLLKDFFESVEKLI